MTSLALAQNKVSLIALKMDMALLKTVPILLLHFVKVNYPLLLIDLTITILHFLLAIQLCNETGAIRLTHGTASLGRLEVCSGGHWGSVCIEGVTNATATVACAQLNHAPQGTKSTIQWNSSKQDLLGTEKKIPDS